ncbi:fimbrial protein [Salmonella enterica]|uniref:Fimbrial protein n=1 Tax=Salmonella enterica subsp. salamae serovar 50:b:z6 TaxID=1967621 RepID=A0A603B9S0_SALER|nr:fimbrial protein [Salmonella enterica]EAB9859842.1 fimbrial protein [Salmonella enterica subsp. salamae]EAP7915925.1 fimbrial protein [Salmonella enterica]EBQ4851684.1 fimbrial protein [Salmonella enterica subsp. salamae]ECC1645055.1 fimbrial protein [Salmonella enterica subsp. salamae]ECD9426226.1 fimbrial protein [Salmonella enterica subsp. salamae]
MKRNKYLLTASALAVLFPLTGQAEDINVDFTATVLATTCSMSIAALDGSTITGDATSGYTLDMGDIGMDKVVKKTTESQKNFKFVASECSASLSKITTTLATSSSASRNYIKNESADSGAATNVGIGFKQKDTAGESWLQPGTGKFDWSDKQRTANEAEMTVALRELVEGAGTPGAFSAKATFNFTYQ